MSSANNLLGEVATQFVGHQIDVTDPCPLLRIGKSVGRVLGISQKAPALHIYLVPKIVIPEYSEFSFFYQDYCTSLGTF